jgi:hypothetical protein
MSVNSSSTSVELTETDRLLLAACIDTYGLVMSKVAENSDGFSYRAKEVFEWLQELRVKIAPEVKSFTVGFEALEKHFEAELKDIFYVRDGEQMVEGQLYGFRRFNYKPTESSEGRGLGEIQSEAAQQSG